MGGGGYGGGGVRWCGSGGGVGLAAAVFIGGGRLGEGGVGAASDSRTPAESGAGTGGGRRGWSGSARPLARSGTQNLFFNKFRQN